MVRKNSWEVRRCARLGQVGGMGGHGWVSVSNRTPDRLPIREVMWSAFCLRMVIPLGMSGQMEVEAKSPRGWEGPGGGADLDGGRGEDASPAAGAPGAKAVLLLLLGSGVSQGLCLVSSQQPCGIGWVLGVLYPFYRCDC